MNKNLHPVPILLALCAFLCASCGQRHAVNEVSVEESGVVATEVDNRDLDLQWPEWRGPQSNGHAPSQDLPKAWSSSTNIRWRADVPGRGHSSPTVVNDLIFLASAVDTKQQQFVLAYDRKTGEEKWRTLIHEGGFPATKELHKKGTNANTTIACDGERAYVAFLNSGKIFATALDLHGDIVWQREIGAFSSKFGYAPSPVLYKSLVIFAADNWGGGYIAALDGESGKLAWRIARSDTSTYSSPGLARLGGRDQLLISGDHRVASFDPSTGEGIWTTQCGSEATCGTVVTSSDRIFSSGGYPQRETVCLSPTGEVLWKNNTKVYEPSMLATEDSLFAVTDDGIAYCWSTNNGEVRWRKRLGDAFSASPTLCNGLIYVSSLSGKTFVFEANADEYREVAVNQLGDDCYASPAIAHGELFLRIGIGSEESRSEQLVCIGKGKEGKN